MAKVEGLTVEPTELSQTIDLDKLTGKPVSSDPLLQTAIIQEVIDYHKQRVDQNKGLGGKALKSPYSKAYQSSLDFIASGKSGGDVNMQLSGDMVGSLDILEESGSKVKIGVSDDDVLGRAYGHQSGFKGHPNQAKMAKYKREWFGVTNEEIKTLVDKKFKAELDRLQDTTKQKSAQDQMIKVARSLRAFVEDID